MKWELAIIAATVLAVAGVSRRLTGTPLTPAMAFVLVGVLVGPLVLDDVTAAPTGSGLRTLAEATLAVVLFADASRIKPRVLRREHAAPLRLLGIGLPLTIALGEAHLPGADTILLTTYVTIGLSVIAHGITAAPLARRYARWYDANPRDRLPAMESVRAPDHRTRGAPNPETKAAA